MRILIRIVHALEHDVFKGDPLAVRGLGVFPQGIEQGLDVPLLVHRHQHIAHRVGGGVERHGEKTADLVRRAGDLGDNARGRQRDAAAAKGDAFAVHRDLHRVADVLEIIKRLAHAHQHDIRQKARLVLRSARHRPFAEVITGQHHLTDDLGSGEVADELLRARMAERTSQRAADLRRDAERPAILFGDIDDLDLVAAGDPH